MNKKALRAGIRARKLAMSPDDIARRSEILCQMVLDSAAYQSAEAVYGYLPFNQEPAITPLLLQVLADGKRLALPRCDGAGMRFIRVTDLSRIRHTAFGVPEPMDDGPVAQEPAALVLVPGLAFDSGGFRIGYGGGYYDRFLTAEPNHPTIALCYDFQLLDHLEPEPHDVPVDVIFSV